MSLGESPHDIHDTALRRRCCNNCGNGTVSCQQRCRLRFWLLAARAFPA